MRWEVSRVVAKVILRDYHFKDNQDISEVRVSVSQYLLQISVENFLAIKQYFVELFHYYLTATVVMGKSCRQML